MVLEVYKGYNMMGSRTVGAANGTSDAVVTEAVPGMGREGKERRREGEGL